MRIYRINGSDFVCANSNDEARLFYKKITGVTENDIDEISELTEEDLDKFKFADEDEKTIRTFREELATREATEFFASTEL